MKIGIPRETGPGERRVAIIPETVKKLAAKRIETVIEAGAGMASSFSDAEYQAAGATVASSLEDLVAKSDAIVKVIRPDDAELARLKEGSALVCLQYPLSSPDFVKAVAARKLMTVALDMIPRTTLAQAMDVLSSQANLAGYWAVVAAASRLPKIFPMLMTAAGTVTPSRVLIMGVGVAGLQAIGTAKRLGAVVEATDVRPETKEQVESLGGRFLMVQGVEYKQGTGGYAAEQSDEYKKAQAAMVAGAISKADVVITTALIPGRKAPVLVTEEHVRSMRPGSVIVDLAAEQGGNVAGSEAGKDVVKGGVTIIGAQSGPSHVAFHASQAFSRNIEKLLLHITADGNWKIDLNEEITKGCVITKEGEIVHAKVKETVTGVKA
ncbi:MAG TPA: Re/Si-specific NAD(P)(+) transhydrogenase subunit alpha [Planctomycetota bacterium]|nr:Re/Si-specific NAD(P)(+) transhydrogenase subunit alpha [Planctomycetota bacterium]